MKLDAAKLTDIGFTRDVNQDRCYADIGTHYGVTHGVFCVSDGMGGLSDGHIAATIAVDAAKHWQNEHLPALLQANEGDIEYNVRDSLLVLFSRTNKEILEYGQKENIIIGTTCSMLVVLNNRYFIAHTGDSRIYLTYKQLLRREGVRLLTEDHTWLADQIKLGFLSQDEINAHPSRNKLTGGLGIFECPRVMAQSGELTGTGAFILLSDGVYRVVSDSEIGHMSSKNKSSANLTEALVNTALDRGTRDNVTAVVVTF